MFNNCRIINRLLNSSCDFVPVHEIKSSSLNTLVTVKIYDNLSIARNLAYVLRDTYEKQI